MPRPKGPETKPFFARLPVNLWGLLHKRAGELTHKRKEYVSANAALVEILEKELAKSKEKKRR